MSNFDIFEIRYGQAWFRRMGIFKNVLHQILEITYGQAWYCLIDIFKNKLHKIYNLKLSYASKLEVIEDLTTSDLLVYNLQLRHGRHNHHGRPYL